VNIGELFISLGVKSESPKIREFEGAMTSAMMKATAFIASLTGVSLQLGHMIDQSINTAVALQRFESMTGLSGQELQRWQIIAQQANVSTEDVSSSIIALQRNIAEIKLGRGNIAPFQLLGIDIQQSPFKILEQLQSRIKGLNRAQAVNLISQLGLSPDMIRLLMLTKDQMDKMATARPILSPEQEKNILKIKLAITQFQLAVKYTAESIISQYGPMIVKGIKVIADVFDRVVYLMKAGVEGFKYFTENFKMLTAYLMVAMAPLLISTFPITAALIALFLVLDDLSVYFRGGKSLTGDAVEGFKLMWQYAKEGAEKFLEVLKDIWKYISDILGVKEFLDGLLGIFKNPGVAIGLVTKQSGAPGPGGIPQQYMYGDQAPAGYNKIITQNNDVKIGIQSTSPAEDVAKETQDAFNDNLSNASLQLANEGY
jgi:hypothetical protein